MTEENALVQQEDAAGIDVMELLYRLLDSWKLLVALALTGMIGAGLYTTQCVTPLYQATSVIYVVSRSDSAINLSDLQLGSALTGDYVKLFSMWELHAQVIEKLELPYDCASAKEMIRVTNSSGTRMLDLTVTSPSAQEAADMANAYAEAACGYIAERMVTDKPTIMSSARVPSRPISPSLPRNMLVGLLLGLVLAAGIVILQFLTDDRFKTADEIRRCTGLVTLAVIPEDTHAGDKTGKSSKRMKDGGGKR